MGLPVAFISATQSLLVIALPLLLVLTGLKISQFSLLLGCSALAFLAGSYYWPRKVTAGYRDRLLKRLLLVAILSQILFVASMYFNISEWLGVMVLASVIFVTRFCYGLTASGVYPIMQAWLVSEYLPATRHAVLLKFSVVINSCRILIPLLAAGLMVFSPEIILVLLVGLPLAAWLCLPRDNPKSVDIIPVRPVNFWPQLHIIIPNVLMHTSLGLTEFIIGPYLVAEWQLPADSAAICTALLLACIAICMVLAQIASLYFAFNPARLLIFAPVGVALGALLIVMVPFAFPAGLIIMAVMTALALPALATAVAAGQSHQQGQASADLHSARILGHLLGVSVAGPLFEVSTNLPLIVAAAAALIVIPAIAYLRSRFL